MKMPKLFVVGALVALAGCGGSEGPGNNNPPPPPSPTDYAPNFTGTWTGTTAAAYTYNGQSSGGTVQASQAVQRTGMNTLRLPYWCSAGDAYGPDATATSATTFSVAPSACVGTIGTCSSVTLSFGTLAGTLSGGLMTVSGTGTVSGCGISAPLSFTFQGTKTSAVMSGGGVSALLAVEPMASLFQGASDQQ